MDTKLKTTLKYMIIGLLLYNLVILVISIVSTIVYGYIKELQTNEILELIFKIVFGIIVGALWSVISLSLMALSIEKVATSQDEKYAKSFMSITSTGRLLVFCIILAIIINVKTLGFLSGIMFAVATFGIKIGAYMVPFIESKYKNK